MEDKSILYQKRYSIFLYNFKLKKIYNRRKKYKSEKTLKEYKFNYLDFYSILQYNCLYLSNQLLNKRLNKQFIMNNKLIFPHELGTYPKNYDKNIYGLTIPNLYKFIKKFIVTFTKILNLLIVSQLLSERIVSGNIN